MTNLICGLAIEVGSQNFMQGQLIYRGMLKDTSVVCAVKGHQFMIDLDKGNKPSKIIEMHKVHSIIPKKVKKFEIVLKDSSLTFEADSSERRDNWVTALLSSLKSAKEELGNHIRFESLKIQESIELENENDRIITRTNSIVDEYFTATDNSKQPKMIQLKSLNSGSLKPNLRKQEKVEVIYFEKTDITEKPNANPSCIGTNPYESSSLSNSLPLKDSDKTLNQNREPVVNYPPVVRRNRT